MPYSANYDSNERFNFHRSNGLNKTTYPVLPFFIYSSLVISSVEATTPGLYTCSVQYRDITESQSSELRMACKLSHYPTERENMIGINLAVPLMANSLNFRFRLL